MKHRHHHRSSRRKSVGNWLDAIRPKTLPASISGVLAGTSIAIYMGNCRAIEHFDIIIFLCCLVFAVLAQIASNFANEYYDYKRGADKKGRYGPTRHVTEGNISPQSMFRAMFCTIAVACVIGLVLVFYPVTRLWLIGAGVIIVLGAFMYSAGPLPLSRYAMGEIAVIIFYGIVPVCLTCFLQCGSFDRSILFASIAVGLLGANILIVNNYRDVIDDAQSGKYTMVVLFGKKFMSIIYLLNGFVAMALLTPFFIRTKPEELLLTLIPPVAYLIMHYITYRRMIIRSRSRLNAILAETGRNMLIFTSLFAFVLVVTKLTTIG